MSFSQRRRCDANSPASLSIISLRVLGVVRNSFSPRPHFWRVCGAGRAAGRRGRVRAAGRGGRVYDPGSGASRPRKRPRRLIGAAEASGGAPPAGHGRIRFRGAPVAPLRGRTCSLKRLQPAPIARGRVSRRREGSRGARGERLVGVSFLSAAPEAGARALKTERVTLGSDWVCGGRRGPAAKAGRPICWSSATVARASRRAVEVFSKTLHGRRCTPSQRIRQTHLAAPRPPPRSITSAATRV
jgi:hypothetical protein